MPAGPWAVRSAVPFPSSVGERKRPTSSLLLVLHQLLRGRRKIVLKYRDDYSVDHAKQLGLLRHGIIDGSTRSSTQ